MSNRVHNFLTILLLFTCSHGVQAKLVTQVVDYNDNKTSLRGYIVYDDAIKGKRPGVLVIHEWWGHNAHARNSANKLAMLGYTAFAVDMYGKNVIASHPKEAAKFSGRFAKNPLLVKSRISAALKVLTAHSTVSRGKLAAIGYCFGGRIALEMARGGLNLKAVASFHGSPVTANAAMKGKFKAQVRFYLGADDPFVSAKQLEAFHHEMKAAGVKYKVVIYQGAKHSFTNPEADKYGKQFKLPLAYNRKADHDSWKNMSQFLKEVFK